MVSFQMRPLTEEESKELQRVSRASSDQRIRHERAVARLSVSGGKSLSEAARLVGWKSHNPVTKVTRRFNSMGLCALDDLPRPGPHRRYGLAEHTWPEDGQHILALGSGGPLRLS
jgi:hypothetical protein